MLRGLYLDLQPWFYHVIDLEVSQWKRLLGNPKKPGSVPFEDIPEPAEYGVSGVMTFIVNWNGTVYQKDLGPKTGDLAKAMTLYNPDQTWRRSQ